MNFVLNSMIGKLAKNFIFCFIVCWGSSSFAASLTGKVTGQSSGLPIQNATIVVGDIVAQSNLNGNYTIDGITGAQSHLITATAAKYYDFGKKVSVIDGSNIQNIVLVSSGEYAGDAGSEYTVRITNPETGYAHIQCIFKDLLPFETFGLDMHYVYNDFLSIENIVAKDKSGNTLPHTMTIRKENFYWYDLTIENTDNTEITIEYDIHYVTICHDGNPECYHAYIGDKYAIFENLNHILFAGASGFDVNGEKTAVRFILPQGWVVAAPWKKAGEYYVDTTGDVIYAAPGVGRLELHQLSVNEHTVVVGVHQDADDYAPLPDAWPITLASIEKGINAANQVNPFDSDRSSVIGIPPLGTNEGGARSVYSPADNFPASFWGLGGMDDIMWAESRWVYYNLEYFGEIILYTSGFYNNGQYRRLIDEWKNLYLNQVYGTPKDVSIADFESLPGSDERQIKSIMFAYVLDHEIRKVSNNSKSLSDVMVYWRRNIDHNNWSNNDLIALLGTFLSYDFTDFFNAYFFGNQKLPVDVNWYYSSDHPTANAGADQFVNEGQCVVLDASGSPDPKGEIISYQWKQINGPTVNLIDATSAKPSFRAPSISDPATQTINVDFEVNITYLGHLWDTDDVTVVVSYSPDSDDVGGGDCGSDNGNGSGGSDGGGGSGCFISYCML